MKNAPSRTLTFILTTAICAAAGPAVARFVSMPSAINSSKEAAGNLVRNADFAVRDSNLPADFAIAGDVEFR